MGWGLGVAAVILVIAEACVRSLAWELLGATGVVKNKKKKCHLMGSPLTQYPRLLIQTSTKVTCGFNLNMIGF